MSRDPNAKRRLAKWRWLVAGLFLIAALALLAIDLLSGFDAGDASALIAGADGVVQYALVFGFAATPLLEILVVIPIGIGLGMNPGGVAVFAFLGNVLPIYGIVAFYGRLNVWYEDRRGLEADEPSARRVRTRAIWDQYGLPGLALVSPILTGVHLAATLALAFGSEKRTVAVWMTVAIALWTVVLTVGSYYGVATSRRWCDRSGRTQDSGYR